MNMNMNMIINMNINIEEAKIIIQSIEQCWSINGFIDDEDKELLLKLKTEFNLKYTHTPTSSNLIFFN